MYVLGVDVGLHIFAANVRPTRLGQLVLAGQVVAAEPTVPKPRRRLEHYVLSIVTDGEGIYRHPDEHTTPIVPGTVTVVRPGVRHWYGTTPGGRWTELFAVFRGPVFDGLAGTSVFGVDGPRVLTRLPSTASLRAALSSTITSQRAAEQQLLSIVAWLVDASDPDDDQRVSPAIGAAASRLGDDLAAALDLHTVASDSGLGYDTFRRRFVAEIGQSPAAYRNAKRLETASTLLRVTDRTLADIARLLGYVDEFHFSRRFRAYFGVSPGAYRRREPRST